MSATSGRLAPGLTWAAALRLLAEAGGHRAAGSASATIVGVIIWDWEGEMATWRLAQSLVVHKQSMPTPLAKRPRDCRTSPRPREP